MLSIEFLRPPPDDAALSICLGMWQHAMREEKYSTVDILYCLRNTVVPFYSSCAVSGVFSLHCVTSLSVASLEIALNSYLLAFLFYGKQFTCLKMNSIMGRRFIAKSISMMLVNLLWCFYSQKGYLMSNLSVFFNKLAHFLLLWSKYNLDSVGEKKQWIFRINCFRILHHLCIHSLRVWRATAI